MKKWTLFHCDIKDGDGDGYANDHGVLSIRRDLEQEPGWIELQVTDCRDGEARLADVRLHPVDQDNLTMAVRGDLPRTWALPVPATTDEAAAMVREQMEHLDANCRDGIDVGYALTLLDEAVANYKQACFEGK
jgi:hypothetical protein